MKKALISRKVFAIVLIFIALVLFLSVIGVVSESTLHSDNDVEGHIYFTDTEVRDAGSKPIISTEKEDG